jgi:hypothetical protein
MSGQEKDSCKKCNKGKGCVDTLDSLLTEANVEQVLSAADQYLILPLAEHCIDFLLHHHRRRHRSSHLCWVLELTHHRQYVTQHAECLQIVKRRAKQVLTNGKALGLLCYDCMLKLVGSFVKLCRHF